MDKESILKKLVEVIGANKFLATTWVPDHAALDVVAVIVAAVVPGSYRFNLEDAVRCSALRQLTQTWAAYSTTSHGNTLRSFSEFDDH